MASHGDIDNYESLDGHKIEDGLIFEYVFSEQSLGIVLRRSHTGLVSISKIIDEMIKEKAVLKDGDILISASGRKMSSNFTKDKWKDFS